MLCIDSTEKIIYAKKDRLAKDEKDEKSVHLSNDF